MQFYIPNITTQQKTTHNANPLPRIVLFRYIILKFPLFCYFVPETRNFVETRILKRYLSSFFVVVESIVTLVMDYQPPTVCILKL